MILLNPFFESESNIVSSSDKEVAVLLSDVIKAISPKHYPYLNVTTCLKSGYFSVINSDIVGSTGYLVDSLLKTFLFGFSFFGLGAYFYFS